MNSNLGTLLLVAAACSGLGAWIGYYKGRAMTGFLLGFLLGVLGLVIIVFMPKTETRKIELAAARQRIDAIARELNEQRPITPPVHTAPDDRAMELYRQSGQGTA